MSICVSISIPYERPEEEFFDSLEAAKGFIKTLSPSAYNWNLDNISVYEIHKEFDIYTLVEGEEHEV